MTTAKSWKWQATQPSNAFFLFGLRIIADTMVALLMKTLNSLESSGAPPRLTRMTDTSAGVATGVIADKTATSKRMLKVSSIFFLFFKGGGGGAFRASNLTTNGPFSIFCLNLSPTIADGTDGSRWNRW